MEFDFFLNTKSLLEIIQALPFRFFDISQCETNLKITFGISC